MSKPLVYKPVKISSKKSKKCYSLKYYKKHSWELDLTWLQATGERLYFCTDCHTQTALLLNVKKIENEKKRYYTFTSWEDMNGEN